MILERGVGQAFICGAFRKSKQMNTAIENIPKGTRVLVTGATGFTGAVLTRKLANAGLKVNAIARHSSNIEPLTDLDIQWFRGNVFDEATVANAVKDAEYIFHLATTYREAKSSDDDFRKVHVTSTKLLAGKALHNPAFKRFVHVSTIGVHGHIEGRPANEDHPFDPDDAYQKTKAEGELWLRDFAEKNNLPFTVVRPAAIYGPGDRRLFKLFKMASLKCFFLLGRGKCFYHLIHVEDLTNAIILAATHPAALGEVFICGNDKPITLADIGLAIAGALGNKIRIVRLPAWPFFFAAYICEFICRPMGIAPPLYRRRVAFFTKDRLFDTQKIRNVLGFQTKYDNETGIAETARWYKEQGWI